VTLEDSNEILVLDGQQRIATATILLSVMRDLSRKLDKPGSHKGADLARDTQKDLVEKDKKTSRYSLKLGELDETFFQKVIQEDPPKPQKRS